MIKLEVAVAAPIRQTYTYLLPPEEHLLPVGRRVLVPFGGRRITGYVLGEAVLDEDADFKILPITEILDSDPLFHPNIVPLFRWIADYYHFPLGEVIKTALPSGLSTRSAKQIFLTDLGQKKFAGLQKIQEQEPVWLGSLLQKGFMTPALSRKILLNKKEKKTIAPWLKDGLLEVT